jgi:hypothetical protein
MATDMASVTVTGRDVRGYVAMTPGGSGESGGFDQKRWLVV